MIQLTQETFENYVKQTLDATARAAEYHGLLLMIQKQCSENGELDANAISEAINDTFASHASLRSDSPRSAAHAIKA